MLASNKCQHCARVFARAQQCVHNTVAAQLCARTEAPVLLDTVLVSQLAALLGCSSFLRPSVCICGLVTLGVCLSSGRTGRSRVGLHAPGTPLMVNQPTNTLVSFGAARRSAHLCAAGTQTVLQENHMRSMCSVRSPYALMCLCTSRGGVCVT